MVASQEQEHIGRRALSFPGGRRISRLGDAQRALPVGGLGAILAEMEARASGVFVRRARELEALGRVLDAMHLGSGATVLIAGEAGIGKTRLVSELAGRARDADCEILVGRSIDLVGTELPFTPFVEALRPLGQPLRAD